MNETVTGHDGIFYVAKEQVPAYVEKFGAVILRHDRRADTLGLAATNFGKVKGCTYDRVIIVPTEQILKYLRTKDPSQLKSAHKLYIAVTRAKYSVAFAVPGADANFTP